MGTNIRPVLSLKNRYWIDRHRYYELKHFCLQYPEWKRSYAALDNLRNRRLVRDIFNRTNEVPRPTSQIAEQKLFFRERIELVESSAEEADAFLADYILEGVTKERSYVYLKAKLDIPCGKDVYYELYRKFFWILSNKRL